MGKTNIRNTLIDLQREETLKAYLGEGYSKASPEQKQNFLSFVDNGIENDVDMMLMEYLEERKRISPSKKKSNKIMIFYTSFSVILTGLSGYGINQENWVVVITAYLLLIGTQSLPYIFNNN